MAPARRIAAQQRLVRAPEPVGFTRSGFLGFISNIGGLCFVLQSLDRLIPANLCGHRKMGIPRDARVANAADLALAQSRLAVRWASDPTERHNDCMALPARHPLPIFYRRQFSPGLIA